ncbi:MAG: HD domain-containing protein [Bacteroidales bacterium]|nr:HD domain-containing protein [Bacteroidales bacterium]
MIQSAVNSRKIINDPVYGFIGIPNDQIFKLIEHPYFQRLRRIKQLGMTHLVYPGALHTRFSHSLGAMHLMIQALNVLEMKGKKLTEEEKSGAMVAILLHDIGHGPYSHALENSIVGKIKHEEISDIIFKQLNDISEGNLGVALAIFDHSYPKKFLSQLVASQLDMDRLDYLTRDSFFTGVSEGVIGTERIIKMLDVIKDNLVVENKGIYSVEKFIIARRIMYWQVYLHKTVISAENMLINLLRRASFLSKNGVPLFTTPALQYFFSKSLAVDNIRDDPEFINYFTHLDDYDVLTSIKNWMSHTDKILSFLSKALVNRQLFRCSLQAEPFDYFYIENLKDRISENYGIDEKDLSYFLYHDTTSNYAYNLKADKINILFKTGKVSEITEVSDQLDASMVSQAVTKHFICYPKDVEN